MAKRTYSKTAIGKRLAALRKSHGFRTPEALAEAIDDDRITKSTLTNLELGKKKDVTVTELLLIARALAINPIELIVDTTQPYSMSDMIDMNNVDIVQWFTTLNETLRLQKEIDNTLTTIRKLKVRSALTFPRDKDGAEQMTLFKWAQSYRKMLDASREGVNLIRTARGLNIEIPSAIMKEISEAVVRERHQAEEATYYDALLDDEDNTDLEY